MRIFACHLLNDYSGSPKVLMQLIKGWSASGIPVQVVTCSGKKGFLSDITGATYLHYRYRWSANAFVRLFNFMLSQLLLMIKLLAVLRRSDLVYVNTVLPFGAALAARIRGCRVIYHVHETSMRPLLLKKFLFGIAALTADDVVYVSGFLAKEEPLHKPVKHILYNAIEDTFLGTANQHKRTGITGRKNVLMVCSLKAYKGVFEFAALAAMHPAYDFTLVVNDTVENINTFFRNTALSSNLRFFPAQTNLHPFYAEADVLLNLSRPDEWVETFGLTVIEAMAYGIPVIVPPVGGIAELVDDGRNGFKVNSRDIKSLSHQLDKVLGDAVLYQKMQEECSIRIGRFREAQLIAGSMKILNRVRMPSITMAIV